MSAASGVIMGLQNRLREWAYRRQGPDRAPLVLKRGRIYILPTRAGWALAVVILALLLAAMNYTNSMGYALAFMLAGTALISMHRTHGNLLGLVLRPGRAGSGFRGDPARLELRLENPDGLTRRDILLTDTAGQARDVADVPGHGQTALALRVTPMARGPYRLRRYGLATRWPFGLFRAWCWIELPLEGIAWPQPEAEPREPPPDDQDTTSGETASEGMQDFAGIRDYRPGDPIRQVLWRRYLARDELVVKQFQEHQGKVPVWFDYQEAGPGDTETRLARLCRWILDAEGAEQPWGLRLPERALGPGRGPAQCRQALDALARWQRTVQDLNHA